MIWTIIFVVVLVVSIILSVIAYNKCIDWMCIIGAKFIVLSGAGAIFFAFYDSDKSLCN